MADENKSGSSQLTLGSLFSGSGGFELAGIIAGVKPIWNSEIVPFAIRVTTKRLPQVKHYGDINKLNGAKLEPVDIITFGSPCQNMSNAGGRQGLHGEKSCLFFQAIRIIKEMRNATNGKYPRYIIWENVEGAYSSNKGEDFRCVLESICQIADNTVSIPGPEDGKWKKAGEILGDNYSVAWRTYDTQYWGCPQRRKRCYLVGDLGGTTAPKVQFESKGMRWYPEQSKSAWKGTAADTQESTGETGRNNTGNDKTGIGFDRYNGSVTKDISQTLNACAGTSGDNTPMVFQETYCLNTQGNSGVDITKDVVNTLVSQAHGNEPCVMTSLLSNAAGFRTEQSAKARDIGFEEEKSPTICAGVVPATVYENHAADSRYTGPLTVSQTVTATYGSGGNNQPLVVENGTNRDNHEKRGNHDGNEKRESKVYGICSKDSNSMKSDNPHSGFYEAETTRTLDTSGFDPNCNQGGMVVLEGNGARPSHLGDGYKESEVMYTLNCTEQHAVAFAEKSATISASEGPKGPSSQMLGNPEENFVAHPAYGIDRATFNQGRNAKFTPSIEEELEPPMLAKGPGAVAHAVSQPKAQPLEQNMVSSPAYGVDTLNFSAVEEAEPTVTVGGDKSTVAHSVSRQVSHQVYHSSKNSHHTTFTDSECAETLVASDYKDPPTACEEPYYIVRRLTPRECAKLQGFDPDWCSDLGTDNPTDEEMQFWRQIFEEYRLATNPKGKSKTDNQIRKWLKNPHTDSVEYVLWGNGVSVPIPVFILSAIVYYHQNTSK